METLFLLSLGPGLAEDLLPRRCLFCVLSCFLPFAGRGDLLDLELSCSAFGFVVLRLVFFCDCFDDVLDVAALFRLPLTLGTSYVSE